MSDETTINEEDIVGILTAISVAKSTIPFGNLIPNFEFPHLAIINGVKVYRVDLRHAAKFKDKTVGSGRLAGECATGVQVVFARAGNPLGLTRTWKAGLKVRGNNIPPGAAIASFRDGVYSNDHAAILIKETPDGLLVWDQFNRPKKPWGTRLLPFDVKRKNDHSNDGDYFYTIDKK